MHIDSLVIETTRRCNLQCPHCLRGNAQRISMPTQVLDDFLSSGIDCISSITFSGGEPSLPSGVKVMEKTLEICRWNDIEVGNFYIATNGKRFSKAFCESIVHWWNYCSENEISHVDISNDEYHYEGDRGTLYKMEEYLWEQGITNPRECLSHKWKDTFYYQKQGLIKEGRASKFGGRVEQPEKIQVMRTTGYESIGEGTLYLNCKGNVIRGCDFSYKNQDRRTHILSSAKEFRNWFDKCVEDLEKKELESDLF